MKRIALILTLAGLMLVGCGGTATTTVPLPDDGANTGGSAPTTATTPEEVHNAWIEAIRGNNRDALLALAATMEYKTAFVDDNLKSLQDRLRGTKDGPLVSVDVRAPTDQGGGKLGVSIWKFERHTSCYGTELATESGVWKVTRWGIIPECPADVKT